jgi:molecular chaperone Hsp33
MSDHLLRITSTDGTLRAMAAVTTDLCEVARQLQQTDPTATVALARVATGTALLGALLKDDQRVALMIEASGPLHKLHAETDSYGHVRCSVKNPIAGLPPKGDRFDVAGAIGRAGFLHVIKDLGLKAPYRSMVQLQTSEVGEDIAFYLTTSEQVPSSVALGVVLSETATIRAAGGLIVQALPGCPDDTLDEIETRLRAMPPVSTRLLAGATPQQLLEELFTGIPFQSHGRTPLMFRCSCSREQVGSILNGLDQETLADMHQRAETVSITCGYCQRRYDFPPEELPPLGD